MVVAHAHINISQTRCFMLNMSSMLPDTITEGTADMMPETNRPTTTPAIDLVNPTTMQEMQ